MRVIGYTRQRRGFSRHQGNHDRGFSLLEVVVSLLVMLIVTAGVMSAMVYGAALRASASSFNGAMSWIQEEHSQIQSLATSWSYAKLQTAGSSLRLVDCPAGNCNLLANGDYILVNSNPQQAYRVSGLSGTSNSSTFTLSPPLALPGSAAVGFSLFDLCTASTPTAGMAEQFRLQLPPAPTSTHLRTFGGQRYYLERTASVANVPPYNLLDLTYNVRPENSSTATVANLYAEVIPDDALRCP